MATGALAINFSYNADYYSTQQRGSDRQVRTAPGWEWISEAPLAGG